MFINTFVILKNLTFKNIFYLPTAAARKRKLNIDKFLEEMLEEKRLKREADNKKHKEKMEQFVDIKNLLKKTN